jgi:fructose-1,6-bisphosphatase/inositol monophosphatase family enzyme
MIVNPNTFFKSYFLLIDHYSNNNCKIMSLFNTKCPFHVFVAGALTTTLIYSSASFIKAKWTQARRITSRIPKELSASSYKKELYIAVKCAIYAGEKILAAIEQEKEVSEKGPTDFVTKTDKSNEALIFNTLRESFPSHMFIGEESSAENGSIARLTIEPTWIVDPIDGTTNFIHTFPFTCVSIGFAVNNELVLGVVYDPIHDELFTAIKGHGSFCNHKRNKTSRVQELSGALVLTEFGYDLRKFNVMASCMSAVVNKGESNICLLYPLCYIEVMYKFRFYSDFLLP